MFYNLIVEVKNRIFLIGITWFSVFFITYTYKEIILFNLLKSNITLNYFIVTDITEVFVTYFKLSQFLAHYFFIFHFCYHFFLFFISGLYYIEYFILRNVFLVGFINLIIFTFLTHFVCIPVIWSFFFKYQQVVSSQIIEVYFETKLHEFLIFYVSFFRSSILSAFVFTVLVLFSLYINKSLFVLKIYRKIFHFFLLIAVVLITPPDLFSFFLTSFLFVVLFELCIFFNSLKV